MLRACYDDLRLSIRGLRKDPRFVLVAALTLALGIGAVTAIFSVVHGVLLTPLPYADPDRLVNVWSNADGLHFDQFPLSPDLYFRFRPEASSFDDMAIFRPRNANVTADATPEVVPAMDASASYFTTFRLVPARGQVYGAAQDVPGAPLVAVISHRWWLRRFGGDASAVGRAVTVDGEPATIVGVLPAAVDDNGSPDLWLPTRFDPTQPPMGTFAWNVSARLRAGVTPAAAAAGFVPLVARLTEGQITGADYLAFLRNGRYRVLVHAVRDDVVGNLRQPLWILLGTVGFVLFIACANVANLFLMRAEGRQREIAVRAALGATRPALVRRQLIDAGVLAALGGGLGTIGAALAVPALIRAAPTTIPRLGAVHLDPAVLAVTTAATALAALLFGLVPALRYTRIGTLAALRQGGRGSTTDRARHRGRALLVMAQTALTLVLLVGSGLLVRSFSRMLHADLGFDPTNVLTLQVTLPASTYPDGARLLEFERRLLERLRALPGVTSAGATSNLPMDSSASGTAFAIDGHPTPVGQLPPILHYKETTPGYLEAMGVRVLRGRPFDSRDMADGSRDVLVNAALARAFWPDADPIGRRLRPNGATGDAWYTIVGVVASERQDGFRRDPPLTIYYPPAAPYDGGTLTRRMAYVVRGPGAGNDVLAARDAVWAVDPQLPVASIRTMDAIVSRSIVPFTFTMLTLGVAAVMALVLGTVGLYGVLSYAVSLRVREIGVRLALGASPSRVTRGIVRQGIAIAGIGLIAGMAAALWLTRFLSGLLYDTPPLDLATFLAMPAGLVLIAAMASYVPARRAAGVSPLESLRSE